MKNQRHRARNEDDDLATVRDQGIAPELPLKSDPAIARVQDSRVLIDLTRQVGNPATRSRLVIVLRYREKGNQEAGQARIDQILIGRQLQVRPTRHQVFQVLTPPALAKSVRIRPDSRREKDARVIDRGPVDLTLLVPLMRRRPVVPSNPGLIGQEFQAGSEIHLDFQTPARIVLTPRDLAWDVRGATRAGLISRSPAIDADRMSRLVQTRRRDSSRGFQGSVSDEIVRKASVSLPDQDNPASGSQDQKVVSDRPRIARGVVADSIPSEVFLQEPRKDH